MTSGSATPVLLRGVSKRYGSTVAVDGLDLEVHQSEVFALLGPNGAGKTTTVRILTTLLRPDAGRVRAAGYDVVKDSEQLRHVIGLAGQSAAVDENLTGLENLEMVGRLYHLPAAEARRRAEGVLERFELTQAADRTAKTYSGGMRRRLDLGASLVGRPQILFLDEPTTGLDPRSRLEMWDIIRELVEDGTTLLLTTQYLDEADRLANQIAVIDNGHVIAEGTSDDLKLRIGGEVLALRVSDRALVGAAAGAVLGLGPGGGNVDNDTGEITLPVGNEGPAVLTQAVQRLNDEAILLADIGLRRPSLDDVFLSLTGHAADSVEELGDGDADGKGKRRARRSR